MAIELMNISDQSAPPLRMGPGLVILGGYSAGSVEERDRHIAERRVIGIEPPETVQLCAKVIGREVVPPGSLLDGWDKIILASEVSKDGREWHPYQRSPLVALMQPRELIHAALGDDRLPDGTVLLSGTIPLLEGVTGFEPWFRARLTAARSNIALGIDYRVGVLPQLPIT